MKDPVINFTNREIYQKRMEKEGDLYSRRGKLLIVGCDAAIDLSQRVCQQYKSLLAQSYNDGREIVDIPFMKSTDFFEDNGMDGSRTRLPDNVSGSDVYVFQNCMDKRVERKSVNDNLYQLLQTIENIRKHEAANITVITPYFPYGRQDRSTPMEREISQANQVSKQIRNAGANCTYCYHPHSTAIDTMYISGIDKSIETFLDFKDDPNTIVLCADTGGVKENRVLAKALNLPLGEGSKDRAQKDNPELLGVKGELEGKTRGIITDDETVTFTSCLNLIEKLYDNPGIEEFQVRISHMRLSIDKIDTLIKAHEKYNMVKLYTTDSIPQRDEILQLPFVEVYDTSLMWALVINKRHHDESVSNLFFKPTK